MESSLAPPATEGRRDEAISPGTETGRYEDRSDPSGPSDPSHDSDRLFHRLTRGGLGLVHPVMLASTRPNPANASSITASVSAMLV